VTLALVHARVAVCWPSHLWFCGATPTAGADCYACCRPVAVPLGRRKVLAICLYCALDRGLVEPVDSPFGGGA
jgi:hypothetical protein